MQHKRTSIWTAVAAMSLLLGSVTTAWGCVTGGAAPPTPGTRYLHHDHRGDLVMVTDESGKVVESRRYGAWGCQEQRQGDSGIRYGFTGQEFDASTGLYYFGARYYDPAIKRWLGPDPQGQFASPYVYAHDAPHQYVDPTGGYDEVVIRYNPFRRLGRLSARKLKGQQVGISTLVTVLNSADNMPHALRSAYYFQSPALVGDTVYIPTRLSRSRVKSAQRRYELTKDNYLDYFTTQPYSEWLAAQPDRSVVLIIKDHGGHEKYYQRISLLEKKVVPEGVAEKFTVCLDTGCHMQKLEYAYGGYLQQMMTEKSIIYIRSDNKNYPLGLREGELVTEAKDVTRLNWNRGSPDLIPTDPNELFHLRLAKTYRDRVLTEYEKKPGARPVYYAAIPDSRMSAVKFSERIYHRQRWGGPNEAFRIARHIRF